MPLKIAFSTVACPDWTLDQVAAKAKEFGFDGVELRTLGPGSDKLASDPALSTPHKVKHVLEDAGVEPVCLSTSLALHHHDETSIKSVRVQIARMLEEAGEMGCRSLRVFGNAVKPAPMFGAETSRTVLMRMAENTRPLLDKAGEAGVQLLFENAGSFCAAKHWWWMLNLLEHPMAGLSWNPANAAAIGESSMVSVPMLNYRIKLAKLKDIVIGTGAGWVQLGEGNVGVQAYIQRLLGVGYDGYLSIEWDRLWFPTLAPADEYLPEAIKRVKEWLAAASERFDLYRKTEDKELKKREPKSREALAAK
jgi:sugar phosphate isomerase/epimerase